MVQCIRSVHTEVEAQPLSHLEDSSQECIHAELRRSDDRVPTGVAPLTVLERCISGRIQEEAGWSTVDRCAGVIRSDASGDTGPRDSLEINGCERHTAGGRDLTADGPFLEERALPSVLQRAAPDSHAGGVLGL